ncbi:MAG: hypothetical protein MPL62_06985 [Alphaproteobacteria bacterium]|nr:hypothetical protein [Alphaproteobacteria bacterium]
MALAGVNSGLLGRRPQKIQCFQSFDVSREPQVAKHRGRRRTTNGGGQAGVARWRGYVSRETSGTGTDDEWRAGGRQGRRQGALDKLWCH